MGSATLCKEHLKHCRRRMAAAGTSLPCSTSNTVGCCLRFSFRDVLDFFQEPADSRTQRDEGRGTRRKPRRETPPVLAANAGSMADGRSRR